MAVQFTIGDMGKAQAEKRLGLKGTYTFDDLKRRHRSLLAENHPDHASDEADRKRRAADAIAINQAYTVLRKAFKELDATSLNAESDYEDAEFAAARRDARRRAWDEYRQQESNENRGNTGASREGAYSENVDKRQTRRKQDEASVGEKTPRWLADSFFLNHIGVWAILMLVIEYMVLTSLYAALHLDMYFTLAILIYLVRDAFKRRRVAKWTLIKFLQLKGIILWRAGKLEDWEAPECVRRNQNASA